MNVQTLRREHPEFCPEDVPIPGLNQAAVGEASKVKDWAEACQLVKGGTSWDEAPVARKLVQAHGAEAFGYYLTFRLLPEKWGLYLRGPALVGLAKEIHRVLNLGYVEMKDHVPEGAQREVAFAMAHDIAVNHLAFHASVDAFAARHEVEDGKEYYAPYLKGPYAGTLREMRDPAGYNEEEVLANLVSLRSFLNPSMTVEFGGLVEAHLSDEEKFRWNGYLMSGNLTSEMTYILRPLPASHKNFTEFLRRRGEVGPYAHMAIQYDLDTEAFHAGLRRLSSLLLSGKEVKEAEQDLLTPVNPPVYLSGD